MTTQANNRTNSRVSRSPYPWKTRRTYPIAREPSATESRRLIKSVSQEFLLALRLLRIDTPECGYGFIDKKKTVTYWPGRGGCLEYAHVLPLITPARNDPARPLIIRVYINFFTFYGYEKIITDPNWQRITQGIRYEEQVRRWSMELSLLHNQVVDFAPWINSLIRAHNMDDESLVIEPPYPIRLWSKRIMDCRYAWSVSGWVRNREYDEACPGPLRRYVDDGRINHINWQRICPELIPKNSSRSLPYKENSSNNEVNQP